MSVSESNDGSAGTAESIDTGGDVGTANGGDAARALSGGVTAAAMSTTAASETILQLLMLMLLAVGSVSRAPII